MEALDESPFSETPVDVVTFVTGEKYLNQPPFSEYQYTLVECMSQIYKEKDIIRYMGEEAGKEHYKKYTKSEIIMQLGKGSGKDLYLNSWMFLLVYKLLCLKDPSRYFGKPTNDAIDIMNVAINAQQAKMFSLKDLEAR
jgi:hypothetical protein